jgi:hypothetical protein
MKVISIKPSWSALVTTDKTGGIFRRYSSDHWMWLVGDWEKFVINDKVLAELEKSYQQWRTEQT